MFFKCHLIQKPKFLCYTLFALPNNHISAFSENKEVEKKTLFDRLGYHFLKMYCCFCSFKCRRLNMFFHTSCLEEARRLQTFKKPSERKKWINLFLQLLPLIRKPLKTVETTKSPFLTSCHDTAGQRIKPFSFFLFSDLSLILQSFNNDAAICNIYPSSLPTDSCVGLRPEGTDREKDYVFFFLSEAIF